ncbi:MAG: sugar ABC transporter ATP-binding protein, partial [Alphaproteobacteria bacterium]|nr:sugar ABC transporter ATP-binding protein [Alphaproteobacteria bacterium]
GSPSMNVLPGRVVLADAGCQLELADGIVLPVAPAVADRFELAHGQAVTVGLRPEAITQRTAKPASVPLDVAVDLVEPLGAETLIYFPVGNVTVCGRVEDDVKHDPKQKLAVSVDMERLHLFDAASGLSLRK